ncbi:sigma-70 family RNA polymerase sigma factor [Streptomyces sp. NPDC048182]|uniref:sigma-70 family RNA polymerase sigma factor n=1 Tax=unclassified Streptomyces TaxID=2593676 RepID=UPI0033A8FA61
MLVLLFESQYVRLLRLARLLGADQEAEDIVSEAFCQLHGRWGDLRSPEAAAQYLRSIVVNLTRMRLRHLQVVRGHVPDAPGVAASAEQNALAGHDRLRLVAALRQLPRRQREALVLRYWMDLREAEIAATMGVSAGAVKTHVYRGMRSLARLLRGGHV